MIENKFKNEFDGYDSKELKIFIEEGTDRYLHILGVVQEMKELVSNLKIDSSVKNELIIAAYLHDIGYSHLLNRTKFHPLDGALFAFERKFSKSIVSAVLFHSGAEFDIKKLHPKYSEFFERYRDSLTEKDNLFIDLVTICDLHRSPKGEHVSYLERVEEIKDRFGERHNVYLLMEMKHQYFQELMYRVQKMIK